MHRINWKRCSRPSSFGLRDGALLSCCDRELYFYEEKQEHRNVETPELLPRAVEFHRLRVTSAVSACSTSLF